MATSKLAGRDPGSAARPWRCPGRGTRPSSWQAPAGRARRSTAATRSRPARPPPPRWRRSSSDEWSASGSPLDRWRDRLGALGIDAHVGGHRDRRLRAEARVRKALLAIAVVEAQLHAPHLPVAHAVRRPGGEADAVAGVLVEIWQVLQADALAVFAVARRARKVVRPAAK